jgi:hypothetical protein
MKNENASQTVFRIRKQNPGNIQQLCNDIMNNVIDVSWKAKAVLLYLLLKPSGWNVRESELIKHSTDGLKGTQNGIKELLDKGYIVRRELRDSKGRYSGWEALVRDNIFSNARKYFPSCEGREAERIVEDVVNFKYRDKVIKDRNKLCSHLKKALAEGSLAVPVGWDKYIEERKAAAHEENMAKKKPQESDDEEKAHQALMWFEGLTADAQEKYITMAKEENEQLNVSDRVIKIIAAQIGFRLEKEAIQILHGERY